MVFFYYESKFKIKKYIFWRDGGGGGEGSAGVSDFLFTMNPNLK